jgi:hypothetical protein
VLVSELDLVSAAKLVLELVFEWALVLVSKLDLVLAAELA